MAQTLPQLRTDLDFTPSPVPDRPGLFIRDPYQYSDATLIVPPQLVECLRFFDGRSTDLDLRSHLVRLTGDLQVSELQQHLTTTLTNAGFLEDDVYHRLRDDRRRQFAEAPKRESSHAGAAYPGEPESLKAAMDQYLDTSTPRSSPDGLVGIVAPHISFEGGRQTYKAAYSALDDSFRDRVFVILGTSHYGAPDRFGLTRKPFVTPYGETGTELPLVDRLASRAEPAIEMEDYCHATEHSIEFQVVFLQHLFGPDIRILPILCGSFAHSIQGDGLPEDQEPVKRFLGELREIAAGEADRLCWVLGVDLAHMGRRYGDSFPVTAGEGVMNGVADRDKARIERVNEGDAEGFWELIRQSQDDLKWCGSTVFYTFLRAVPEARGRLLDYRQWNIDEQSAVSFAAMAFSAP